MEWASRGSGSGSYPNCSGSGSGSGSGHDSGSASTAHLSSELLFFRLPFLLRHSLPSSKVERRLNLATWEMGSARVVEVQREGGGDGLCAWWWWGGGLHSSRTIQQQQLHN